MLRWLLGVVLLLLISKAPAQQPPPQLPFEQHTVSAAGVERTAWLILPPKAKGPKEAQPKAGFPLVVVFHGAQADPREFATSSRFGESALREGYILAAPEVRSPPGRWYTPNDSAVGPDDGLFVKALVDSLCAKYPVDKNAIFAAGVSNGGTLCYNIAATMGDTFAAVAVYAGMFSCTDKGKAYAVPFPRIPVSLLIMHGKKDDQFPIAGGGPRQCAPLRDSINFWCGAFGFSTIPKKNTSIPWADVNTYYGGRGGREMVVYIFGGTGHALPFVREARSGRVLMEPATETWKFFARNKRKG